MAGENMANLGKAIIAGEVRPAYFGRPDPGGGTAGGCTGDVKGKNVKERKRMSKRGFICHLNLNVASTPSLDRNQK